MSLRLRFALWIGGVSVAVITLVALASFQVLEAFLERDTAARLQDVADRIEVEFEDDGMIEFDDGVPADVHHRVIMDGRILASSRMFPDVPTDIDQGCGMWDDHVVLSVVRRDDGRM